MHCQPFPPYPSTPSKNWTAHIKLTVIANNEIIEENHKKTCVFSTLIITERTVWRQTAAVAPSLSIRILFIELRHNKMKSN